MIDAIASRYRRFAASEALGKSALYEAFASGVADDSHILAFLDGLPPEKQQPNLLFAAVRVVCGTAGSFREFRRLLLSEADAVRAVMIRRRTQTNEPGRCAVLLPLLVRLPEPLALIEVGASAGLCLLPDRYGYDYGDIVLPGNPMMRCRVAGNVTSPRRKPAVAWRAGLDLDPVDVGDADAVAWLEALVWPDQPERLSRLRQAIEIARAEPPVVMRGDLRTDTVAMVEEGRRFGTVVVFHTAVLAYLEEPADRVAFGREVMRAGAVWISNEAPSVVQGIVSPARPPGSGGAFLLRMNGIPVAWADPHGQWFEGIS